MSGPRRYDDEPPEALPLAELREGEPHWFNLPNLLTFLRALLVPVILWLLAMDGEGDTARWWAFGVFVFAAATDSIDGWVARRWNGVTRWGQLADPIADKLLIIGSLASLALVDELPWWAVNVIIARELAVTLLRVRLIRRLDLVMPASHWGKAKTVSQVVAVAAYLSPGVREAVAEPLLNLAVVLTIWSGIEYAFRAGRLARTTTKGTAR
ncbi:MAG TPA: CDP-diacylglycerol--glycerol-3-phosphate 3-phosphatidyltransferase [Egicoccus sp.]|nr:CDP-diacylglycerol--glycerol-3-phosphate 3-phosphatidyltransferase [Egicoccus sp.]HSK22511.1 CDP-diacylglycerol--glycerol-3-phosphate 3-phosphatidyltransferase [Egicoccus sp.]